MPENARGLKISPMSPARDRHEVGLGGGGLNLNLSPCGTLQ